MKNILMIATYFPPMGGIGVVRITKYAKYLRNFGWNPTILTTDERFITNRDESLLKDIEKDIEVIRLNFESKHNDISKDFYKQLKNEIANILGKKKYDMVFLTVGPFFILPIGEYIYKKFKIDFIIDMRDPWKLQTFIYNSKKQYIIEKLKRVIKGFIENKSFKNAKRICTVNDTMTEEYKKEYPKYQEKFVTITNGFDIDDYKDIQPCKVNKDFTIIYTGKFETAAGFRDPRNLFKAIKLVNDEGKNVRFIHIGKEENKVKDIAKEENCEQYCKFLGLKKFNDTISYCKGADVLIAICGDNKNEQTGKIFDYICCNKPVIVLANRETDINNVCKNFNNIYSIEKNNVEELKNTISRLYNNECAIKENNLKNNKYNRKELTRQLVELL